MFLIVTLYGFAMYVNKSLRDVLYGTSNEYRLDVHGDHGQCILFRRWAVVQYDDGLFWMISMKAMDACPLFLNIIAQFL